MEFICCLEGAFFPGAAALLSTVGTALLIHAGSPGSSVIGRILTWRPLVFIGLISYPLYREERNEQHFKTGPSFAESETAYDFEWGCYHVGPGSKVSPKRCLQKWGMYSFERDSSLRN